MVKKKVTALLLMIVVSVSALWGCGNSASDQAGPSNSPETETASEQTDATEETSTDNIVVSMFLQDSADQAISTDLPIIQEITKRTGIDFEFVADRKSVV